jgi:signal transduction histidine kinase
MQISDMHLLLMYIIAVCLVIVFVLFLAALMLHIVRRQQQQQLQRRVEQQVREQAEAEARILQAEHTLTRISRELHDGVCQELAGLRFHLGHLSRNFEVAREPLQYTADTVTAILNRLRMMSHSIHGGFLQSTGFITFLHERLEQLNLAGSLQAVCAIEGPWPQLHPQSELALIRIVAELIQNTVRHAEATRMHIQIDCSEQQICIRVGDNGKGFTYSGAGRQQGLGIRFITEYAASIHAEMLLDTAPGRGTTCSIICPVAVPPSL